MRPRLNSAPVLVRVFFFGLICLTAAADGAFTVEQVMSAPFASHPVSAPKGSAVVWLMNEQGRRNIWIASGPEWNSKKLTHFENDDGQELDDLTWTPDAKHILFTRGGDFETGRENPNPALSPEKPEQAIWSVAVDGSPEVKLTEGHAPRVSPDGNTVAFLRSGQIYLTTPTGADVRLAIADKGAGHLKWSPDGKYLAYLSTRGGHSFLGVYSPSTKALTYLDASVDLDSDLAWSPDSASIAHVRNAASTRAFAFGPEREGEPWSLRVTNVSSGESRETFRASQGPGSLFHELASVDQLFWTPSNRIVFPWEKSGWSHLYSISASGNAKPVELTPGEGEVEHASLSADGKVVYYSTNIGDIDRRHIWAVTVPEGKTIQLTKGEGIET